MEEANIRIHVYRIVPSQGSMSVEDMLRRIRQDELEDRTRRFGAEDMRLEQISCLSNKATGEKYFYLDFVRLRDTHGPGRASRGRAVQGFELDDDDYFGEETAALFLPATGYLLMQYNHYGVKPRAVAEYLGQYLENVTNAYDFFVKADPNAERVFQRQNIIRRLELGIDLAEMNTEDRAAGRSLGEMAKLAKAMGGRKLKITISVGMDKKSGLSARTKESIADLLLNEAGALTKAEVAGRETADSDTEVVDLLQHKLTTLQTVKLGKDRRFPFEDRRKALKRAYDEWKPVLRK